MANQAGVEAESNSSPIYRLASRPGAYLWSVVNRSRYILPAAVIGVFLIAWQELPAFFNIPTYELPTLGATLTGLQNDWSQIGTALLITLQDALAGFILGNLLAILGATAFSYSRTL